MNTYGKLVIRTMCLGAVVTLAASPSLPIERVSQQSIEQQLGPAISDQLDEMSTGDGQDVLLSGGDAQSRNARIAVVKGKTRSLSAYTPIALGSGAYSNALKCLTQAVYYEAANEPRDGKRAVAQVVLNRMRHPAYPNSVCGVVYEGVNAPVCQFSFTCDGALTRAPLKRQWQESERVAKDALSGNQMRSVGTATHYHADYVVPKWAYTLSKLDVIGRHIFYRFPGRAGEPRAFAANWARSERIPEINWARFSSAAADLEAAKVKETWVPGLTVAPDPADRHAAADVGGRIDTTKQWRLTIPDPVSAESSYSATVQSQAAASGSDGEISQ
ncbi:cell wall hydrolase [Erythrobacter rubeus]|uniref:Cell wall hydrolase n=1 Tax=Erythrobacter rubeus TaxID=2760803 RepID=A0ABR8KLC9_9SPHN|nr:cell wall hydrolase [Erythrobacter rubeus]MBD2841208.1 cell wall hydrolase [Erythrobacter rubeus]